MTTTIAQNTSEAFNGSQADEQQNIRYAARSMRNVQSSQGSQGGLNVQNVHHDQKSRNTQNIQNIESSQNTQDAQDARGTQGTQNVRSAQANYSEQNVVITATSADTSTAASIAVSTATLPAAPSITSSDAEPLVSVIVPVYGVERYLDECVTAIVGQTYRNLEIVLVDDGSPDHCPAMCDAWAAKDARIHVIHKVNGGLSDARNAGLAYAHGDYIYFADSDDVPALNLIEQALHAADEYAADLVMFQFDTISENGVPLLSDYKHNDFNEVIVMTPVEAIKAQVKAEIDGYFWSFIAAAPIYRDHDFSFPVGRKIEDMARICNVIGESHRVVRIPEVLYHYRLRRGSITASWTTQLGRDWMKAADDREAYIVQRYPELKQFMRLQQLTFFANLDYETIRQSLTARLNIDPEDADHIRRRIEGLSKDVADDGTQVPESTKSLLDLLKDSVSGAVDDFREMREEWRRIGPAWKQYMHEYFATPLETSDRLAMNHVRNVQSDTQSDVQSDMQSEVTSGAQFGASSDGTPDEYSHDLRD